MPYEHDGEDARAVIAWISKQPWSDSRVGMYGGSYSGFAQWAAAKNLHPANSRMVSRRLSKGSRLLVTLNINKNSSAQINYGTGKDVSDEDITDAKIPLQIKWHNNSYVRIPIWK